MAPSNIKRFTEYLRTLGPTKSHESIDQSVPALDLIDFVALQSQLSSFLGKGPKNAADSKRSAEFQELVESVLQDCTEESLVNAIATVEKELIEVEGQSIDAYMQEAEPLNALHSQIGTCENRLGLVEDRLGHFDGRLLSVNKEILTLEQESERLSLRLANRVQAADRLNRWLDDTTVPPELVTAVSQGDESVAEVYKPTLAVLRSKITKMKAFVDHESLQAWPTMQGLKVEACRKVERFLTARMHAFKPGAHSAANTSVLRGALVPYAPYISFLEDFAPDAYAAVSKVYRDSSHASLSWTMRAYMLDLVNHRKLAPKVLLLPQSEVYRPTAIPSFMTGSRGHANVEEEVGLLSVGERHVQLLRPEDTQYKRGKTPTARPFPMAGDPAKKDLSAEAMFKHLLQAIASTAASEYTFLMLFFASAAPQLFTSIWEPVLELVHQEVKVRISELNNPVATLTCARLVHHFQLQMLHARVPVLDSFLDGLLVGIWPHFSHLMREQIDSICDDHEQRKARGLLPSKPVVLPVVRRWTALFISLTKLNAAYGDSQIHQNITEMYEHIQSLLYQVRILFKTQRSGEAFLVLNLRLIVSNLRAGCEQPLKTLLSDQRDADAMGLGEDGLAICCKLEESLKIYKLQFRTDILSGHLQPMISFVAHIGRARAGQGGDAETQDDVAKASRIITDFKKRWRDVVTAIRTEVLQSFEGHQDCGDEMCRLCLEGLYDEYRSFLNVLAASTESEMSSIARAGPSLQSIAYDLKEMLR